MKWLCLLILISISLHLKAEEKVRLISHSDKLPPPGVKYQYVEETTPAVKREATVEDAKAEVAKVSKESDSIGINKGSTPPIGRRYFFIEDICIT